MSRYSKHQEQISEWKPRTPLGSLVLEGKINSMEQVYENGMRIHEAEIVKHLIPDMKTQVVHVGIVQKQTVQQGALLVCASSSCSAERR